MRSHSCWSVMTEWEFCNGPPPPSPIESGYTFIPILNRTFQIRFPLSHQHQSAILAHLCGGCRLWRRLCLDMFSLSDSSKNRHFFVFSFLALILPSFSAMSSSSSSSFPSHTLPRQTNLSDSLSGIVGTIHRQSSRREVFRVFRIFTRSWVDVRAVRELRDIAKENSEIDFWLESANPGQFADVMISPEGMNIFERFLADHPQLSVEMTVDDVEKLIFHNEFYPQLHKRTQNKTSIHRSKRPRGKHFERQQLEEEFRRSRRRDQPPIPNAAGEFYAFDQVGQLRGSNYPWGEYTGYSTMVRYLRTLEFYYPHLVQLVQLGTTHEGRSIEGVKIGYNQQNATLPRAARQKRIFWIDGNMHAREWASGHTALFIINQLVWAFGKDPFLTNALAHLDFVIVPCANPDGFEYSRSSLKPQIRLWRKNRSPEQCTRTAWGGLHCCRGVDLNRNFDFHWAETGSSLSACSNLFSGKKAFSEPEARAIADFLRSDEINGRVDAFITLHTYAQLWIHPYSHEYQNYPSDVAKMRNLALKATSRLREVYGTSYRVGTGADLLAPASGGSDDWAKETLGVKFVYLVELRPQQRISNGFILRQEELLPTAIETFEAVKVIIQAVLQENALPAAPLPAIKDLLHSNSTASSVLGSSPSFANNSFPISPTDDIDVVSPATSPTSTSSSTTLPSQQTFPISTTTTTPRPSPPTFVTRTFGSTTTTTTTSTATSTATATTTLQSTAKATESRETTKRITKLTPATRTTERTTGTKRLSKTSTTRSMPSTAASSSLVSGGDEESTTTPNEEQKTWDRAPLITASKTKHLIGGGSQGFPPAGVHTTYPSQFSTRRGRMAKKNFIVKLSAADAQSQSSPSTSTLLSTVSIHSTQFRFTIPSVLTRRSKQPNLTTIMTTSAPKQNGGRRKEQFREQFMRIQSLIGKGQQRVNVATTSTTTTSSSSETTVDEESAQTEDEQEEDGESTTTVTATTTTDEERSEDEESSDADEKTASSSTTTSGGWTTTTTVLDSGAEHGQRTVHSDEIDLPSAPNPSPAGTSSPASLARIVFVSSLRLLPSPDPFVDFEVHRRDAEGRTIKLAGGGGTAAQQQQSRRTLGDYWRSLFAAGGEDNVEGRRDVRERARAQEQRNIRRKEPGTDADAEAQTTIVPPKSKCRDERSSCAFWIRAHPLVCTEQMRYMRRNCALSCGFCAVGRSRK